MYINLSGLNILITDAHKGVGKAMAIKLAEAGACIAIHYHNDEFEAEELANIIENGSKTFQANLSDPNEVSILFDKVILEMDTIDILINNANIDSSLDINASDEEWIKEWSDIMMFNLNAAALLSKKLINHVSKKKISGRIINITSKNSKSGSKNGLSAYASSKAGLTSLTKSIALSYGKIGIRAFSVALGHINLSNKPFGADKKNIENLQNDLILEKLTEPKDISSLITLIASGLVDHATGTTFDFSGGDNI